MILMQVTAIKLYSTFATQYKQVLTASQMQLRAGFQVILLPERELLLPEISLKKKKNLFTSDQKRLLACVSVFLYTSPNPLAWSCSAIQSEQKYLTAHFVVGISHCNVFPVNCSSLGCLCQGVRLMVANQPQTSKNSILASDFLRFTSHFG